MKTLDTAFARSDRDPRHIAVIRKRWSKPISGTGNRSSKRPSLLPKDEIRMSYNPGSLRSIHYQTMLRAVDVPAIGGGTSVPWIDARRGDIASSSSLRAVFCWDVSHLRDTRRSRRCNPSGIILLLERATLMDAHDPGCTAGTSTPCVLFKAPRPTPRLRECNQEVVSLRRRLDVLGSQIQVQQTRIQVLQQQRAQQP